MSQIKKERRNEKKLTYTNSPSQNGTSDTTISIVDKSIQFIFRNIKN